MTTNQTPNRAARLEPLSSDDYERFAAWKRQNEPTVCPCCQSPTNQGWLDDQGCCYFCSARFDADDAAEARRVERPGDGARLVKRGERLVLTIDW
jgi:hypothetical protein